MAGVVSGLKDLGLMFIPLFVATDALGILPFVLSLTQDMNPRERGKAACYAMLILNLLIAWLIFAQATRVAAFWGRGGLRATSKIPSLLSAAIAVKMIRQGFVEILAL